MASSIRRAVYDCMVFLQGIVGKSGPAVACIEAFEEGRVRLIVSEETLMEVKEVLSRPRLVRKFDRLTPERVESLISVLRQKAELVPTVPRILSYERDPKDEPYLNLLLASGAEYLVTRDKDLLDLMKSGNVEANAIREKLPVVKIVDPATFLLDLLQSR